MGDQRPRRLRVAAAQIEVGGELDLNLETILGAVRDAAAVGAELVVTPEAALTGYSPAIGHGRDADEWPSVREGLATIAGLASELGIWVAVGTEVWDGEAWLNRLQVYSDHGQPVAAYDKVHLFGDDARYYRPGAHHTIFQMRGIKIGLQICYDVRFPEGYRSLLAQGAEVVLQGFYAAGGDTWKLPVMGAHLRSRAAENGFFLVAANVAGPLQFVRSQIVDPSGLLLGQANQDHVELVTATLDLGQVSESMVRRDCLAWYRNRWAV